MQTQRTDDRGARALRVERRIVAAGAGDLDRLIARLDRAPGLFHGCDVSHDPLYERRAIAFVDPAVRIEARGNLLDVRGLDAVGRALVAAWQRRGWLPSAAQHQAACAGWRAGPHPVIGVLRGLLASFDRRWPELGLHGAWSFEHWRWGDPMHADATPRCVLFLPARLLVVDAAGARWVSFDFPGLELGNDTAGAPAAGAEPQPTDPPLRDDFAPGAYAPVVAQAIERIRSGALLSLTLSQAFRRRWQGNAAEAFAALRERVPMPEMFFANLGGGERLFGASPDLQARADASELVCLPACGTVKRGADPSDDLHQIAELWRSDKEAAALALCSDAFAAAMHRVCEPASVHADVRRRIVPFAAVVHGIERLHGRLRADADPFDVLLATAAPPTLAGVPRAQAAAAIAELEAGPRGWYGGAIGHLASDGSLWLGTVLRAAWLNEDRVELRSGGSIVVASDPSKEDDETQVKAAALFRLLGLAAEPAQRPVPVPTDARGDGPRGPAGASPVSGTTSAPVGVARARCVLQAAQDPFAASLADLLERCGVTVVAAASAAPAATLVVHSRVGAPPGARPMAGASTDAPQASSSAAGASVTPTLLIGDAALDAAFDWPSDAQARPAIAAPVTVARAVRWMSGLQRLHFGAYVRGLPVEDALRPGWLALAWDGEGRVLVAADERQRRAAVLLRPDSVLSSGAAAGERLLRAVLAALVGPHA